MSCQNTEDVRIILKYSSFPGETPTIPNSANHEDGTWLPTDLYVGEMFINAFDNLAWVRGIDGIFPLGATGGTVSFIGDFVHASTGGTFSGPVTTTTLTTGTVSTVAITASNIFGDVITANYFIGDGSGLTNIQAVWNGGTVSNPVLFNGDTTHNGFTQFNGVINGNTNGKVVFDADIDVINGYGVSASYFIGDGSQLTNLPVGTYSNYYTNQAVLSGNTIVFDRTDLAGAYSVDLTPILATDSIASMNWVSPTQELVITYTSGYQVSTPIDSFGNLAIDTLSANYIYGGQFFGSFTGTFSGAIDGDIYTTAATLNGSVVDFSRTDGTTYSVDLSTLAGSGGTQSLAQTLKQGNTMGTYSIVGGTSSVVAKFRVYDEFINMRSEGSFDIVDISISPSEILVYNSSGQGITYDSPDANLFMSNTLVHKQYVDTLVAGATHSLSEVLASGNETGNNDIVITVNPFSSTSDRITAFGNILDDANFSFEDLGGGAWAPTMRTQNNASTNYITVQDSDTYIHNSQVDAFNNRYGQIEVGPTSINTSVDDLANGRGTELTITSTTMVVRHSGGTFSGIQYDADYSADYSNRSLVDKEYVDNIAGGGGTLQQTLALGNTTGTYSIYIGSSASKIEGYNGVSQHWYNAANFLGDYFQIENGTGASASFIKLYDDNSGNIHLASNNGWDLSSNDAFRTSIYMSGNTQILSENRDFAGNTFHNKSTTIVSSNGTTTETRDMINDTSAMVSTYTDGAGTQTYGLLQAYHNGGLKAGQIYVYNDRVNLKAEDNGVSFTNIELNYTDITVSGTPSFGGMKYDRDYSANYTNRSLVDKAYVDSNAGGAGITYSGQANYLTFFDTNDSLLYTGMHYNSGRYTIGYGAGWSYDNIATFGVYTPYTTGPAVIAESSQFGGLFIASGAATGQTIGLQGQASGSTINGNVGVYGQAGGTQSSNIAGSFYANDGTIYPGYTGFSNLGLDISVTSYYSTGAVGLTNSGININVGGRVGDYNYIGQLRDGSEGVGKVLTCISADGLATWQTPTGGGATPSSLAQVLTVGNTASTSIDMNGNSITEVGSLGTPTGETIEMTNIMNAALLTLMYNT